MTNDNMDAEELLQESKEQSRATTPAAGGEDDTTPLKDAIRQAYEDIDNGEKYQNLTIRDQDLAALVYGLEEADELDDVATAAQEALGKDADKEIDNRGPLVALLARVGLDVVASDKVDAAKEANREYLASQADDF